MIFNILYLFDLVHSKICHMGFIALNFTSAASRGHFNKVSIEMSLCTVTFKHRIMLKYFSVSFESLVNLNQVGNAVGKTKHLRAVVKTFKSYFDNRENVCKLIYVVFYISNTGKNIIVQGIIMFSSDIYIHKSQPSNQSDPKFLVL